MAELEQQKPPLDALGALHKMSTTAGIASADYVAVSNLAVFTGVVGVATALAIIWWQLAILALPAVLLGLLALRSIRRSNGTLTGGPLAIVGIALAVLLAGAGLVAAYLRDAALEPTRKAINARVEEWGRRIVDGNDRGAYELFDSDWRKQVSLDAFSQNLRAWQAPWQEPDPRGYGKILRVQPNNRFYFYRAAGAPMVSTRATLIFEKPGVEVTLAFDFRKQPDGSWLIDFCELFPNVQPRKSAPPTPPAKLEPLGPELPSGSTSNK